MKSVIRAAAGAAIALSFCVQAQQQARLARRRPLPVKIGQTTAIHKVAGDVWIDEINRKGGLLGRKVEWLLKDDQSRPHLARTLYEKIIRVDKVDLIIGPSATANILSAMGVAQRYNKLILHNSFGTPRIVKYDLQFPTSGGSGDPESACPNLVLDAAAAAPRPPKTLAIVTSKFPSLHFISVGARDIAKKRGLNEVLWLEWEFGNREFGPIASRIKDARPDFVFVGATGLDAVMMLEAMKKIDYQPPMHFYMFPSPGPTAKVAEARGAMAFTTFQEHAPFTSNPRAAQFVKAFHERAKQAGLPDTAVDLHASIAYSTWQTLEAAVNGAKSLDDKAMAQWLRANPVETIMGRLSWPTTPDGPPNYMMGKDIYKVKQLQDGKWVVVWPKEFAAPGAKLQ